MRSAVVAMALAGCTAMPAEPGGTSTVSIVELPISPPTRVDLVVVLDDAPALVAHADAIAGAYAYWQQELATYDARIAVIATSAPDELRLGSAGDLASLLALGSATGTGESLATAQAIATSPSIAALRRPEDLFGITIIAGADDRSPGPVADYAAAVAPLRAYVDVLGPVPPSRLTSFADAFPNLGSFNSIDNPSYVGADLAPSPPIDRPVLNPCFDQPIDPTTCVVSLGDATLSPPAYAIVNNCIALDVPPPDVTETLLAECVVVN